MFGFKRISVLAFPVGLFLRFFILVGNLMEVELIAHGEKSESFGFVAEWEYHGQYGKNTETSAEDSFDSHHETEDNAVQLNSPPNRSSSAVWQDAVGSWWIFGGRINTSTPDEEFLSDLWVYEKSEGSDSVDKFSWKSILDNKNQVSSSVPENIQSPILCGSNTWGNIGVFGSSSRTSESSFLEDNLVWVYNIPKSNSKSMGRTSSNTNGDEGVWTSYICCDLCEPDLPSEKNTTTALDFCPHFSETFPVFEDDTDSKSTTKERSDQITAGTRIEPILWCAQDSLMALQLTFAKSRNSVSQPLLFLEAKNTGSTSSKKLSNESSRSTNEQEMKSEATTKIHLSKSNGTDLPRSKFSAKTTTSFNFSEESQRAFQQSEIGSVHSKISSKDRSNSFKETQNYLNWWKFNLATTEWEKMPQVITFKDSSSFEVHQLRQLFDGKTCRTTTDSVFVYILCLPIDSKNEASTIRNVFVFDLIKSTIEALPTSEQMQLNVCFEDSELWKPTNSILHTLRIPESGQTIILLAYNKLIDFWVHDHLKNTIVSVENLWKGTTLDNFQHHSTFYKLKIQVGNSNEFHHVFLPNPRNYKTSLFNFNDTNPDGWFHIKIESDEHVFLPSRDTSFMINVEDEQVNSAKVSLSTPVQSFLKVEPQEFPNDKRKTQLDSHLAQTDNKTTSLNDDAGTGAQALIEKFNFTNSFNSSHSSAIAELTGNWRTYNTSTRASQYNAHSGQQKLSKNAFISKYVIPSMFRDQKKSSIFNELTSKALFKDSTRVQNGKGSGIPEVNRIRQEAISEFEVMSGTQPESGPVSIQTHSNAKSEVTIRIGSATPESKVTLSQKLLTSTAFWSMNSTESSGSEDNPAMSSSHNPYSASNNVDFDTDLTQSVTNNEDNNVKVLSDNSSSSVYVLSSSLIINSLVDNYGKSDMRVDESDAVGLGDKEQSKETNDYDNFEISDGHSWTSKENSSVNSIVLCALFLAIIAAMSITLFIKSCVKCPARKEKAANLTYPRIPPTPTVDEASISMTYAATRTPEEFYLNTPNI